MSECNCKYKIIDLVSRIREKSNSSIEKELESRNIFGLLPAHSHILGYLFFKKTPVSISELVEASNRVKSTVTVMIKTLEKHGYVTRIKCANDGRVTYISLTEKAKSIEKDFAEVSRIVIDTFYKDIPADEINRLIEVLTKVENNFRFLTT